VRNLHYRYDNVLKGQTKRYSLRSVERQYYAQKMEDLLKRLPVCAPQRLASGALRVRGIGSRQGLPGRYDR